MAGAQSVEGLTRLAGMITRRVPVVLVEPTVVDLHLKFSHASNNLLWMAQASEAYVLHLSENVVPHLTGKILIGSKGEIARQFIRHDDLS